MSQKKFWKEFRNDMKHGLNRHNDDISNLKSDVAKMKEKDKGISEKMDAMSDTFDKHDKAEMAQYSSIDSRLRNQARMLWIGVGVILTAQFFLSQGALQGKQQTEIYKVYDSQHDAKYGAIPYSEVNPRYGASRKASRNADYEAWYNSIHDKD